MATALSRSAVSPWLRTASNSLPDGEQQEPDHAEPQQQRAGAVEPAMVFSAPEVSASFDPPPMPHATLRAIHAMSRWIRPSTT